MQSNVSGLNGSVTTNENLPMFVSTKIFSAISGLSVDTICKMCNAGRIAHIKNGRRFLINYKKALEILDNESSDQVRKTIAVKEAPKLLQCNTNNCRKKHMKQQIELDDTIARLRALAVGK